MGGEQIRGRVIGKIGQAFALNQKPVAAERSPSPKSNQLIRQELIHLTFRQRPLGLCRRMPPSRLTQPQFF